MNITLKNIGTLKEASFDLDKDFIVFIGPNNTGKTYAAYCLYGLCKFDIELSSDILDSYLDVDLSDFLVSGKSEIDLIKVFSLENANHLLQYIAHSHKNYLSTLFGFKSDYFEKSLVSFSFANEAELKKCLLESGFTYNTVLRTGTQNIQLRFTSERNSPLIIIEITDSFDNNIPTAQVANKVKRDIIANTLVEAIRLNGTHHFIPAERIGISVFLSDIYSNRFSATNELIAINALERLNKFNAYSIVIQDALNNYNALSRISARSYPAPEFERLAMELEQKLLKGTISNDVSGNIYFTHKNEYQLKIQGAGSIVKSLTSLLLYIKYEAQAGQVLIIDEPEINLHPDNQRLVARILAKLSKLGVKVIVSTHSDYFIRELNNLMMLNKQHPETQALREKYGYDESEILDHTRVGAYLFKDNIATALPVTDTGMEAATIDEEINRLNNTANDIYWTLFED